MTFPSSSRFVWSPLARVHRRVVLTRNADCRSHLEDAGTVQLFPAKRSSHTIRSPGSAGQHFSVWCRHRWWCHPGNEFPHGCSQCATAAGRLAKQHRDNRAVPTRCFSIDGTSESAQLAPCRQSAQPGSDERHASPRTDGTAQSAGYEQQSGYEREHEPECSEQEAAAEWCQSRNRRSGWSGRGQWHVRRWLQGQGESPGGEETEGKSFMTRSSVIICRHCRRRCHCGLHVCSRAFFPVDIALHIQRGVCKGIRGMVPTSDWGVT